MGAGMEVVNVGSGGAGRLIGFEVKSGSWRAGGHCGRVGGLRYMLGSTEREVGVKREVEVAACQTCA